MTMVRFEQVDVVFGRDPAAALALVDQGFDRAAVLERTGAVVAVHGATLGIEAGEICVLMGLSGSGKSSLLRCVNGLNPVSRGRVLVRDGATDIDVALCEPATLRRLRTDRIAMVFQQFALLPWRTVAENVGFGLELRGMSRAERERLVDDKLALVGLAEWRDKYAHELSGGMQQRVGLARALATDADILLMDEPFSALDPLIRDRLQEELLELQRGLRKTIIFVSHDLDEALRLGGRIAIMESGRIVQSGPPEEIVLAPADDYVRAFVANVNPLNVLRGGALMRPVERLAAAPGGDGRLSLDRERRCTCRIDPEGRPVAFEVEGRPARCIAGPVPAAGAAPEGPTLVAGTPETSMRDAILANQATGNPMPLLDPDGRLLGVIGAAELLAGLTRREAGGATA